MTSRFERTLAPGVGLGWRPETALLVERRETLAFSEVIAESIDPANLPPALAAAVARGLPVVAHGVALDLGGTEPLDRDALRRLAWVAQVLCAPLVSEHIAFRRAGAQASPHFLPVPHTHAQLAWLVDRVRTVQDALRVPLALENVAAPIVWPGAELAEADFVAELVERTGAQLLLDVANLHANLVNHGGDLARYLDRLPLDRLAYLHVAGGAHIEATGMWRDTHAHPIDAPVVDALAAVLARTGPVPVLLERDRDFGTRAALEEELEVLAATLAAAPACGASRPAPTRPPLVAVHREALAAEHDRLFAALDGAPSSFAPAHLTELRAILAAKHRH